MTELEKLQRAKMYIDKLANGINPIDDVPAAEGDIINNVRLSRCLFYVSDILRQVIENNGVVTKGKASKKPFFIETGKIAEYNFADEPLTVSEITEQLNALADLGACRKLSVSAITGWLIEIGALQVLTSADGKGIKRPTKQGEELGILTEQRTGMYGEYTVVLYNKNAQQFIVDNIETIVNNAASKNKAVAENQGQPWTPAHEECLVDLFNKNVPVSEIAVTLKRSEEGVRARLKRLGIIESRSEAR